MIINPIDYNSSFRQLSEVVVNVFFSIWPAMFLYEEETYKYMILHRASRPFVVATYTTPCQVVIVSLWNLTEASGVLAFSPEGHDLRLCNGGSFNCMQSGLQGDAADLSSRV